MSNDDLESESLIGAVKAVSGPVVIADRMNGSAMYELVQVGSFRLVGEIIRLEGDTATIQVYEETGGLTVGDPVYRTGKPLSLELGPGIMSEIFDGIQRPLDTIFKMVENVFIPKGIQVQSLNHTKLWEFHPKVRVGDTISAGDIFGQVVENSLMADHAIMVPPRSKGRVTYIAPAGNYSIDEEVVEIEIDGKKKKLSLMHRWPVRQPRPVAIKESGNHPLLTGQRVLDAMFPCSLGGACVLESERSAGRALVPFILAKYANTSPFMYVVCDERFKEVSRAVAELDGITTRSADGREHPALNRCCVVANASNMSVGGREAAIHTGATIAEYYRDMGKHVALSADSLSRWAEALKDVAGHLSEAPGANGYPPYMASRLAGFFDRAGRVRCLGGPQREGSLTIIGVVSPHGDVFEPDVVTEAAQSAVQTSWVPDVRLAYRKHFPCFNWHLSKSDCFKALSPFYSSFDSDADRLRATMGEILRRENDLTDDVRAVGKDALPDRDRIVLETAQIIREEFLQQNNFTSYDSYCPVYKWMWMMRNIVTFYDCAQAAVASNTEGRTRATWSEVSQRTQKVVRDLQEMKFRDPRDTAANIAWYKAQRDAIIETFDAMTER